MSKTNSDPPHHKLLRVPSTHRITKRPLLRPAIPSPYTSRNNPKIVYISSKTPFMSAVQRVRKLFRHVEARATQAEVAKARSNLRRKRGKMIVGGEVPNEKEEESSEPVVLKATGKAIGKALNLGLFLQGSGEYNVEIRTGSVGAVDDIERKESFMEGGPKHGSDEEQTEKIGGSRDEVDVTMEEAPEQERGEKEGHGVIEDDIPESRIRFTSVVEISLTLR